MSNELVIGVDVGFGNTKTAHTVFSSGIIKHSSKPPMNNMVVETHDGFYSVGSAKNTIQESKTTDENMLILTEAAIAEELKRLGMTTADIHLGVGVPLTRMGAEKEAFHDYYTKNRRLVYKYEDVTYSINLLSVSVFPQGYAGVTDYIAKFSRLALVIDIGSWTVDIIPFRENRPDLSNCNSLSEGTINCMHKINEELRSLYNGEADEIYIKDVMMTGTCKDLPPKYLSVIEKGLHDYVENLMGQLRALKFNLDTTQLIFIGGGATIIKNFLDVNKYPKATIIDDVHINAKGYENAVRYKIRKGELK